MSGPRHQILLAFLMAAATVACQRAPDNVTNSVSGESGIMASAGPAAPSGTIQISYRVDREGSLAGTRVLAPSYTRSVELTFHENGGVRIQRGDSDPRLPSSQPEVRPVGEALWSGGQFRLWDSELREFEQPGVDYQVRDGLEAVVAAHTRERPAVRESIGPTASALAPAMRLDVIHPDPARSDQLLRALRDLGLETNLSDGRISFTGGLGGNDVLYVFDPAVGAIVQIETQQEGRVRSRTEFLHHEATEGGWELQAIAVKHFQSDGELIGETVRTLDGVAIGPQLGGGR